MFYAQSLAPESARLYFWLCRVPNSAFRVYSPFYILHAAYWLIFGAFLYKAMECTQPWLKAKRLLALCVFNFQNEWRKLKQEYFQCTVWMERPSARVVSEKMCSECSYAGTNVHVPLVMMYSMDQRSNKHSQTNETDRERMQFWAVSKYNHFGQLPCSVALCVRLKIFIWARDIHENSPVLLCFALHYINFRADGLCE